MTVKFLAEITCPEWLPANTVYLVRVGSFAFGVDNEESDIDLFGCAVPPKDHIFPHLRGEIPGFGKPSERFTEWEQHHVEVSDQTYDFKVYSIVKLFNLCMLNNPNVLEILFAPQDCIMTMDDTGKIIRDNRKKFLHKGAYNRFMGFAHQEMSKFGNYKPTGGKKDFVDRFGYDLDGAYHFVRILNEIYQILTEGDLNLRANADQLREIRNGQWSIPQLKDHYEKMKRILEGALTPSPLPDKPDEGALKKILLNCLETHFGTLRL